MVVTTGHYELSWYSEDVAGQYYRCDNLKYPVYNAIIILVPNRMCFFSSAAFSCGLWLPLQSSKIPFGLWPRYAHFLFTLPSNPLQPRQSIFSAVLLFSLFLPLKPSVWISHSSLVHHFVMSIPPYSQPFHKRYKVCCFQYNLRLIICSYFRYFFFFFHATWISYHPPFRIL